MKITKQTQLCRTDECGALIAFEITGAHDLRSTGQVLDDVAQVAGWVDGLCPDHRTREPERGPEGRRLRLVVE